MQNVDWGKVFATVNEDFARLGISARFKKFESASKLPKFCYVLPEMTEKQLIEISRFRREGRFPTVCY